MKAMVAVKTYLEKDAEKISIVEFKKFWDTMNDAEKKAAGQECCKHLGTQFEEA